MDRRYTLALQTIAGGIDLTQSAAAAGLPTTGVICHGDGAVSPADTPGSTGDHQPCGHCGCCMGAPSLLVPPAPVHLVAAVLAAGEVAWPPAERQNTLAFGHPSQRPRGPPPQA